MSPALPTHQDLARAAKVTVTTIKSYRRKFPEFFPVASQGKPLRFEPGAVKTALAVSRHFRTGLSVDAVRAKLVEEFGPPAGPRLPETDAPAPPPQASDPLARIETLMNGLFSLQNRTHSLMAELVAKLDTLADRLGPPRDAPAPAPPPAGPHPPVDMLALPVVIQGASGQYLGVTTKAGTPFSLDQFEGYLRRRARNLGCPASSWAFRRGSWVLALTGPGQAHEHHFRLAHTPRGNTVALFHQLVVGGKVVSEAFLQTFLRQVKETFDG